VVKLTEGQNWFDGQVHIWDEIVRPIIQQKDYCRALEIGSWEGGSACWILSELCSGSDLRNQLVCIDHFDMMSTEAGRNRWELFNNNLRDTGLIDRTRVLTQFSTPALFKLMNEQINEKSEGFNLIYIDASHRSDDTLLDAEMAWRLGSEGCVIIFDDYEWDQAPLGTIEHPKNGIDAFLSAHCNEFVLLSKGYQVIIQKTAPLRVGFL
tara:strand:- start:79 stop:705 length:627 start_codon:yes stop_codon:yes gene_type:complete